MSTSPANSSVADTSGDVDALLQRWRPLLASSPCSADQIDATGRGLLASWAEPQRRYHMSPHLQDVLDRIDELADHAADLDAVRLAAWYHDAVYAGRPDNEDNSARRADSELSALGLSPELVSETTRLIRLTATPSTCRRRH